MPKKNFKTLTIHESVYDKVRTYYQEIKPRNLKTICEELKIRELEDSRN